MSETNEIIQVFLREQLEIYGQPDAETRNCVVSAANRMCVDQIVDPVIVAGVRHYDQVMHAQVRTLSNCLGKYYAGGDAKTRELILDQQLTAQRKLKEAWQDAEQGFIDRMGNFLTRQQAWTMAHNRGQIRRIVGSQRISASLDNSQGFELFSENLY